MTATFKMCKYLDSSTVLRMIVCQAFERACVYLTEQIFQQYFYALIIVRVLFQQLEGRVCRSGQLGYSVWYLNVNKIKTCRFVLKQKTCIFQNIAKLVWDLDSYFSGVVFYWPQVSSCASNVDPLILKLPPPVAPCSISSFIWMPFDRPEHTLSYGKDDNDFNKDASPKMTTTVPKPAVPSQSPKVLVKYYLHRQARTHPFWPACLSFCGRAFVHLLNLAPIRTYSSNSLASSSATTITRMFVLYQLMDLHVVSSWSTIFNIGCLMSGTNLALMLQCQVVRLHGYSTRCIHISCTCATQTATSFCPISLLLPVPQFKRSSMAPFALAFPHGSGGYKHMPATLNCAQFVTSR